MLETLKSLLKRKAKLRVKLKSKKIKDLSGFKVHFELNSYSPIPYSGIVATNESDSKGIVDFTVNVDESQLYRIVVFAKDYRYMKSIGEIRFQQQKLEIEINLD